MKKKTTSKKQTKRPANLKSRNEIRLEYHKNLIDKLINNNIQPVKKKGSLVNDSADFQIKVDIKDYKQASKILDNEYKKIKQQWDKEDNLYLNRTALFLTVNALLVGFSAFQSLSWVNLIISIISSSICFFWIHCSLVSYKTIGYLFTVCTIVMPKVIKNMYSSKYVRVKHRPNKMLLYLPFICFGCWIIWVLTNLIITFLPFFQFLFT